MSSSGRRPERNPVLGIEFGYDSIRAVEVRKDPGGFHVTAAGTMPMPPGALDPGSVTPPQLVGQRVKALLRKMGASARHGVLGVPSTCVLTRLLDVPSVADEELGPVVAGEVAHYQMVRPGGGAFDFLKLQKPEHSREAQVVVMAADDPILWSLESIASTAGVIQLRKEPSQLGAVRAAIPPGGTESPVLVVAIEDGATEIAIVWGKRLPLYRRIDVGGRNLLANVGANVAVGVGGGDSVPAAFAPTTDWPVDEVLSARLATEIRRSVDYFRRENPTADVDQAVLSVMDPRLEGLAPFLGRSLAVDCQLATPPVRVEPAAATELKMPYPTGYMGALGLAMGALGHAEELFPHFDLVPAAPSRAKRIASATPFIVSAAASAAVLVIGFVYYSMVKAEAKRVEDNNIRLEARKKQLEAELKPLQARREQEIKVLSDLANQTVPFPWVMDEISRALDPQAGIVEVSFDNGRIRLQGEAQSEVAMINTLDRLRMSGHFGSAFIDNFDNRDGKGVRFNLSSGYSIPPAELPTAVPVGTEPPGADDPKPAGLEVQP